MEDVERHGPVVSSSRGPARAPWFPAPLSRFARWAWFTTAYMLSVILFGAWVRISGSGAGCGQHWPTCHGEVVPRSPSLETMIEYGHRLTSGALGLLVLGLAVAAVRSQRPLVRRYVLLTGLFVLIESALGAGLVKAELVANDASMARAIVVGLHLCNTLLLTACSVLTAWYASVDVAPRLARGSIRMGWWVGAALMLVSATGAVTALGDTIFPKAARFAAATGVGAVEQAAWQAEHADHFLVQLRAVHPVIAVAGALLLLLFARRAAHQLKGPTSSASRNSKLQLDLCWLLEALVWSQLGVGVFNILLGAPGWMQLLHLFGAQLVWLCFVVLWVPGRRGGPQSAVAVRLPRSS